MLFELVLSFKATEEYFSDALFNILYKMISTFKCMDDILSKSVTIQLEAHRAVGPSGTIYFAVISGFNFFSLY